MLFGGIEGGGTKMVCAVGTENGEVLDRVSFPTRGPEETFADIIAYFSKWEIDAIGLGSFGPVDLDPASKTYGFITQTPKPGWENEDVVGRLKKAFPNLPVGFDTDVNGAVLGEVTWGAAKGCNSAIYITIGTGVGVGVYINGGLVHGLIHPEAGHVLLQKDPSDTYQGRCPFHSNCVEGLASGPAVEERWGSKAHELADRPEVWELEANYIAQAIMTYLLTYSPQKVILWGGIMHQEQLFPLVRKEVQKMLNGYLNHPLITEQIKDLIVPPALGDDPGILGAIQLAALAYQTNIRM